MEGSGAVDRVNPVDGTREVDGTEQVDVTFAVDKTVMVDIYVEVDKTPTVDGTAAADDTDQVDEIDDIVGMNIGEKEGLPSQVDGYQDISDMVDKTDVAVVILQSTGSNIVTDEMVVDASDTDQVDGIDDIVGMNIGGKEGIPSQVDVCRDTSDLVDKTDVATVILQSTGSNTVTDEMVVDTSDTHLIALGKPSSIADCEAGGLNAWSEWPGVKDVVDGVTGGGECSSQVNTPPAYTFEEVEEVPFNVAEAAGNKRVPRPSHYLTDDQFIGDPRLKALYASRTKKPIYHPIASVEESDYVIFKQILEETLDE
ncbi:hypothetical protein AALP_AAs72515U000100 [Arabis alpina]|uniref:Uncharacterized protein n=1 Tax=Arabis alpina TaxID=50452 RepID=A0A087FZV5_ARAAL|nr:hypothetical protein AALP_AAs72515U000100 [Arabis alpina]